MPALCVIEIPAQPASGESFWPTLSRVARDEGVRPGSRELGGRSDADVADARAAADEPIGER